MNHYKYDWILHNKIRKQKPKPKYCEKCKKKKPIDLANISHKYKNDIKDWFWLCRKCHMEYDKILERLHKPKFKKICLNCKKEFLSKTKTNVNKYCEKYCKICSPIMKKLKMRNYGKKYRKDNWDKIYPKKREWLKQYLEKKSNREKYNKTRRKWYQKNREKQIKATLKYREKNKEKYLNYMREYHKKNG